MNSSQLLTIDAHKRKLQGAGLAALLLILDEPQTLGHLANRIGISSPAMTGCANILERKGYAVRTTVSGDKRKLKLQITPRGVATIEAILQTL